MKKYIFTFLILAIKFFPQSFEFQTSFGEFSSASSFYITSSGFIYVVDYNQDEMIMLDTLGNELKNYGGYGWDENSFDDPADVFADPLSVYIADKNNHTIKRFDKNLNYISSLNKRESSYNEEQFGYPISCATSNQGDLYFIDSENKRVMKFDVFGNFITSFGGLDAGKYQLKNPIQLAINSTNNIFIIDDEAIVVFDHYGNGISRFDLSYQPTSIRIIFDQLVVCSETEIYHSNLKSNEAKLNKLIVTGYDVDKIISALLVNSKLYVLSDKTINVFAKIN